MITDGIFYNYNKNNIYDGSSQASIDPLQTAIDGENVFTLPANATWKAPGTIAEGKQAEYTKSSDTWAINNIPKVESDIIFNSYGIAESTLSNGVLTAKSQSAINTESDVVAWENLRAQRNKLLLDSDYSQLLDVQEILSDDQKTAWIKYRQDLRDLPANTGDPQGAISYPSAPA